MKAGGASIGILQKLRIKNLRGVSEVRLKKKLVSFTLETSKNHLIRKFLRNGRLRVKLSWKNFKIELSDRILINQVNSGQETALHYDSPYFLDVSRKTAPVWLLVALKQSGIWDHKEVHQIQGVAYMSWIQTYEKNENIDHIRNINRFIV